MEVAIREARPDETNLIYVTWLKSYAQSSFAKGMVQTVYEDRQRRLINEILKRNAKTLVAHAPEEPDAVLGWLVLEEPATVHYLFVKEHFRRLGVGTALVAAVPKKFRFTHRTFEAVPFIRRLAGALYDPYAAWRAP